MKFQKHYQKIIVLALALMLTSFTAANARFGVDYRFKVSNNTNQTIKKVLVSEDGKKYGYFDIGDGIEADETVTLVWDKSTDEGNCEWLFKAVFEDGSESKPVEFDFCEKNMILEFK